MIDFRLGRHSAGHGTVVEIWNEGRMIATVYGRIDTAQRAQLHLVTKHGIDIDIQNAQPFGQINLSDAIITIEERD